MLSFLVDFIINILGNKIISLARFFDAILQDLIPLN